MDQFFDRLASVGKESASNIDGCMLVKSKNFDVA
jgi:hypothetical protein